VKGLSAGQITDFLFTKVPLSRLRSCDGKARAQRGG